MKTADYVVTGLGTVVSGVGMRFMKNKWGMFALGFGLAHVVLGVADMFLGGRARS